MPASKTHAFCGRHMKGPATRHFRPLVPGGRVDPRHRGHLMGIPCREKFSKITIEYYQPFSYAPNRSHPTGCFLRVVPPVKSSPVQRLPIIGRAPSLWHAPSGFTLRGITGAGELHSPQSAPHRSFSSSRGPLRGEAFDDGGFRSCCIASRPATSAYPFLFSQSRKARRPVAVAVAEPSRQQTCFPVRQIVERNHQAS